MDMCKVEPNGSMIVSEMISGRQAQLPVCTCQLVKVLNLNSTHILSPSQYKTSRNAVFQKGRFDCARGSGASLLSKGFLHSLFETAKKCAQQLPQDVAAALICSRLLLSWRLIPGCLCRSLLPRRWWRLLRLPGCLLDMGRLVRSRLF